MTGAVRLITTEGYPTIEAAEDCGFDFFYQTAQKLETVFQAEFVQKIDGFDSLYYDFLYRRAALTLHYNVYQGLCIYPTSTTATAETDKNLLTEMANRWQKGWLLNSTDVTLLAQHTGNTLPTRLSANDEPPAAGKN